MAKDNAEWAMVLGLAREQVPAVQETAPGWTVQVQSPRPTTCPTCGGTRWHRHGTLPPGGGAPGGEAMRRFRWPGRRFAIGVWRATG